MAGTIWATGTQDFTTGNGIRKHQLNKQQLSKRQLSIQQESKQRLIYWQIIQSRNLKERSDEIFYLRFFHKWTPHKPLTRYLKTFRIGIWTHWDILIFDRLSAIIDSGESILPMKFTTESCNSPHRLSRESLFIRIICINSRLSFTTESHYSPPHL